VSWLRIKIDGSRTSFQPGEVVAGTADWKLDGPARPGDAVELRLLWFTSGRGTRDAERIATAEFESPAEEDHRPFRFELPRSPYSFEGRLITLTWALEAAIAGKSLGRLELTVSPTGEPVRLG
jgi:hypothetical protein